MEVTELDSKRSRRNKICSSINFSNLFNTAPFSSSSIRYNDVEYFSDGKNASLKQV